MRQTAAPTLTLTQIAGPPVAVKPFAPDRPVTIGRSSGADLQLRGSTISRLHAELRCMNNAWTISDANSKHGSTLNGSDVSPTVPQPLLPGDTVTFGPWSFTVDFEGQDRARAATTRQSGDGRDGTGTARAVTPRELAAHNPSAASLAALLTAIAAIDEHTHRAALQAAAKKLQAYIRTATVSAYTTDAFAEAHAADPTLSIELLRASTTGLHIATTRQSARATDSPDTCLAPVRIGQSTVGLLVVRAPEGPLEADPVVVAAAAEALSSNLTADRKRERTRTNTALNDARRRLHDATPATLPLDRAQLNHTYIRFASAPASTGAVAIARSMLNDDGSVSVLLGTITASTTALLETNAALAALIHPASPQSPEHVLRSLNRALADTQEHPPIIDIAALRFLPALSPSQSTALQIAVAGDVHTVRCSPAQPPAAIDRPANPPLGVDSRAEVNPARFELVPGDRITLATNTVTTPADYAVLAKASHFVEALTGSPTVNDDAVRLAPFLPPKGARTNDATIITVAIPEPRES